MFYFGEKMTDKSEQADKIENDIRELTDRILKKKLNPFDAYIGYILKTKRKELKLSQTQIAYLMGVTFQQVQKYEKGTNKISSDKLLDLTYMINMPFQTLIDGYECFKKHLKVISELRNPLEELSINENERKKTPVKEKKEVLSILEKIKNFKGSKTDNPFEISSLFEQLTPQDFQNFYQSALSETQKASYTKNTLSKKTDKMETAKQMFNLYKQAYQRIEQNPFGEVLENEMKE